jgi:glycogen debranching enzyme GlgX/4-alpha-glucanotransferase
MAHRVTEGSPAPLGVTLDERGANVAVFSAHASAIEFCLFDNTGSAELTRIRLPARTGDVFHGHVADIRAGQRYGLRAHGPFVPADGHRFNANKLLVDPYALALDRAFSLHPTMFGIRPDDASGDLSVDDRDSAPYMPKAIVGRPASVDCPPRASTPWPETVIYELHVRGFSKLHPRLPPAIRGTFAGLAHPESIDHLAKLGVTAVEIMPATAWIEEPHLKRFGLTNYWGYNPVALMAPDPRLAPRGWSEIRDAVRALQAAGIEVILDVVLNHSGEGGALGPTLSLRGLDNATYYRLAPDNKRLFIDDAGCGNVLALDRPAVAALAIDALSNWATYAGIDGFRFDLATTLGRRDDGFDVHAPLIEAISQHPIVGKLKLIAEPWDVGPGGYRLGGFPDDWREWNDRFRDSIRRFWRGDAGLTGEVATRIAGSSDLFGSRRPSCSVNFVTAHDGFTLADLVSYAQKHNEANGEQNRDGADQNHSWNNGVEGPSADAAIVAKRRRDQRNLLATLLLARGTPMLAMGTEFSHSQKGNNNAYAQDNETSWLDWAGADQSLFEFCRQVIALRKTHPALRQDEFLKGRAVDATLIPDVEWRRPDGRPMQSADWHNGEQRTLVAVFYSSLPNNGRADRFAVILHAGADFVRVTLPSARDGRCWRLCLNTAHEGDARAASYYAGGEALDRQPASLMMLEEVGDSAPLRRRSDASPELLDRLARAVGIAPEWFDIAGARHLVSDETKRALLHSLNLDTETDGNIRESLMRLSQWRERSALPLTWMAHDGQPVRLRLAMPDGAPYAYGDLVIQYESGEVRSVPAPLADLPKQALTGCDGRPAEYAWIELPPQPQGRHLVLLESRPEFQCRLTVAPTRCYLPDGLAAGRQRFGLAVQLYSLRSRSDQGIGDFSTLATLAEAAADQGAATVGLNPMHALFSCDRSRASPYHPSDRRFLDPIYIDVTTLDRIDARLQPSAVLSDNAARVAALAASPHVDYADVWALKRLALEESHAAFDRMRSQAPQAPAASDFAAFVAQGGVALQRFATFEAISEQRGGEAWTKWPTGLKRCCDDAISGFARTHARLVDFHLFLQWLCERQFAEAARRAESRGLFMRFYRDLAIGAAPDGAEAWMSADELMHGISIGAPPDPLAEGGQVWGLPPPNPLAWYRSGYAAFRELIAANMRHAGALRIDHAMGLTRLFLVPEGAKGSEGAYLSYPFDDLMGELALESSRAHCVVVGETLGTVPTGFREKLASADVLSYRVLWFERSDGRFIEPSSYEQKAVACVSTHDLPTLSGWWQGEDIREKQALGLLSTEQAAAARTQRETDKRALLEALQAENLLTDMPGLETPIGTALATAIHAFIGRSSSVLAMAQVDDLAGVTTAVNLPGTDRERPNWSRKLPMRIDEALSGRGLKILAGLSTHRNVQNPGR